jgi:hypothetical protein
MKRFDEILTAARFPIVRCGILCLIVALGGPQPTFADLSGWGLRRAVNKAARPPARPTASVSARPLITVASMPI